MFTNKSLIDKLIEKIDNSKNKIEQMKQMKSEIMHVRSNKSKVNTFLG